MKITRTTPKAPPRIIVYSEHKVGKSTFAAGCPRPIFIDIEGGLGSLGVDAFEDKVVSYDDVMNQLKFLATNVHEYKTVAVDSLDWLERLVFTKVCTDNNWAQIGDGSYGAGYKLAQNYWSYFIKALELLNKDKKMMVVLLAHSKLSKFEDPERDNYDRWTLDLNEKLGNMVCEWSDIIGFASYKTITTSKQEGFTKTIKAKTTGERVLNLNNKAAFEAGNRYNLPDQIPLNWKDLETAIAESFKARVSSGNLETVITKKEAKETK